MRLITKQAKDIERRNAAIYAEYTAMMRTGSMKMPVYERLAKKYSLSVYFVGKIIREARKEGRA
jgi:Mor family transcriptional regulator